jgi:probable HAF family extracellular repeat protein
MIPRIAFTFRFLIVVTVGFLLFSNPGGNTFAATTYQVVRLPGLTASGTTFGWAINERGEVTGWSQTSSGPPHAIIYADGATRDLGALGGTRTGSYGFAINNQGQVAGRSDLRFGSPAEHAFLYSTGNILDLGTLGGQGSFAKGLNDLGEVVGGSGTANGALRGFLYRNGQMTQIDAFIPAGINNQGQMIGHDGTNAVLYDHGTVTSLGSLGGQGSYPYALNQRGDVVGGSPTGTGMGGAFLYSGGRLISLGTTGVALPLSIAFGINNHGSVVGEVYNNGTAIYHAFLYEDGQMRDLNNMVNLEPGMVLSDAQGINDAGQIIANGNNGGPNNYAFLVTPNCEPPVLQSVSVQPTRLWPPNHKMQKVAVTVDATSTCGPTHSRIASVTLNDGAFSLGRKASAPDFEITGELTVNLRAEKSAGGAERVYTLTIECTDALGNTSTGVATVSVAPAQP